MAGEITPPTSSYPTAAALGNIALSSGVYTATQVVTVAEAAANAAVDAVEDYIGATLSTVWKAGPSKTASQINDTTSSGNLLVAKNEGFVYNITEDVTTDSSRWVEGSGLSIPAGTDVAVINTGTAATPSYKFTALAQRDASVVKSICGVQPDSCGNVSVSGDNGISVYENCGILVVDGSGLSGAVSSGLDALSGTVSGIYETVFHSGTSRIDELSGSVETISGYVSALQSDTSGLSGSVSGLSGDLSSLSGDVSTLSGDVASIKNFSKLTVLNSSGNTVTNGAITPSSNADTGLQLKAGNNVTLSMSGTKTVVISASGNVTDVKISGTSVVSSGVADIPVATAGSGNYGVVKMTSSLSNDSTTVPTTATVNTAVNAKVTGSSLHQALSGSGLNNGVGSTNNTIYALINALHSVDGASES